MLSEILLQVTDETLPVTGIEALQKITSKIGFRLMIDILSMFVMIRFVYFPVYRKRELVFTFFTFNVVIFFISYLLNKVDLSLGAAFGLFAVFGMLRYRTEGISIKDMTYLFLVIAIGLISAVTKIKGADDFYEYLFLLIINFFLIAMAYSLESRLIMKKEAVKLVLYEKIELINDERRQELLADLRQRTGINVHRIYIQRIDFLKDVAYIKIYYYED